MVDKAQDQSAFTVMGRLVSAGQGSQGWSRALRLVVTSHSRSLFNVGVDQGWSVLFGVGLGLTGVDGVWSGPVGQVGCRLHPAAVSHSGHGELSDIPRTTQAERKQAVLARRYPGMGRQLCGPRVRGFGYLNACVKKCMSIT